MPVSSRGRRWFSMRRLYFGFLLWSVNQHHNCWAFSPIRTTTRSIPQTPLAAVATTSSMEAFSMVESFFLTKPYVAAFLTCSFKASAADWMAQWQQQQHEQQDAPNHSHHNNNNTPPQPDIARNIAFLVYGGLYQGIAQQFMYSNMFPTLFGHDWLGLVQQVTFDMAIIGPLLCLPTAYFVKSLVQQQQQHTAWYTVYWQHVTQHGLLYKYWGLWTPVNFVTFGIVPVHFRVAFVAAVSFFWVFVLSSVVSSTAKG